MKTKIYAIMAGIGIALAQGNAQAQVNILEILELNDTISVTYNGAPVLADVTGPVNGWTIELPAPFSLNSLGEVLLGEPESAALMNSILVGTQPRFLTWSSDQAIVGGPYANSITIPNAGVNGTAPFDLRLVDRLTQTVPDAGSTLALLGLAFAGLAYARPAIRRLTA